MKSGLHKPTRRDDINGSRRKQRPSKFIERFSIECRKTKTKVITTANQNRGKYQKEPMRIQSKRM